MEREAYKVPRETLEDGNALGALQNESPVRFILQSVSLFAHIPLCPQVIREDDKRFLVSSFYFKPRLSVTADVQTFWRPRTAPRHVVYPTNNPARAYPRYTCMR
ncbi:hypothetical protein GALMADRAFT_253349, partial [Galerina marginata CBS 339.88]